jgi:hypothetical protein
MIHDRCLPHVKSTRYTIVDKPRSKTERKMKEHIFCHFKTEYARRKKYLKPNAIGIAGGIIALISLALPWWTMTMSSAEMTSFSEEVSIYPYQATASIGGTSAAVTIPIWYAWAAFVLVVIGGSLGILGSLVQSTRIIVAAGGLLALLSIIIFAAGLQDELSKSAVTSGGPSVGLFSSGSFMGIANYTTYLSFGFWLALIAAIIMLVSSLKKPKISPPTPTPPPPT